MGATLYGYSIESDVPLPRARTGPASRGTLHVRTTEEPLLNRNGRLVRYDADIWALARTHGGLLVWCPGTGSYHADVASGVIEVQPDERHGIDDELAERDATAFLGALRARGLVEDA
jgi:hypothetical protein